MKENEAPEKIYITNYDIEALPKNEQLSERWHEVSTKDTDIEYTRTDAFIEKAEKYLTEKFIKDVCVLAMGRVNINFAPAISNFLKYMKEE